MKNLIFASVIFLLVSCGKQLDLKPQPSSGLTAAASPGSTDTTVVRGTNVYPVRHFYDFEDSTAEGWQGLTILRHIGNVQGDGPNNYNALIQGKAVSPRMHFDDTAYISCVFKNADQFTVKLIKESDGETVSTFKSDGSVIEGFLYLKIPTFKTWYIVTVESDGIRIDNVNFYSGLKRIK